MRTIKPKVAYDYSKLRGRIVEKFGNLINFSNEAGISNASLSQKLNNKIGIDREEMVSWSGMLDIDSSEYGEFFCTQKL